MIYHHSIIAPQHNTSSKPIYAKTLPSDLIHNNMVAITDSGASDDMSSNIDLFEYTVPLTHPKEAVLGDNTTSIKVTHYGPMNYMMNGYRIRKMGYLVLKLGTTLLSIKHHMKFRGKYFHAEDNSAVMAFPTAVIDIDIEPEMQVNIAPALNSNIPFTFDETEAILSTPVRRRKYSIIDKEKIKFLTPPTHKDYIDTVRVKKLIPEAKLSWVHIRN